MQRMSPRTRLGSLQNRKDKEQTALTKIRALAFKMYGFTKLFLRFITFSASFNAS